MNHLSPGATAPPKQGAENLSLLLSGSRTVDDMTRILSGFGKINSTSFMPHLMERGMEELVFFVNFEKSDAAMAAANCLDCILYGFSTVVVRVPVAQAKPA